MLGAPTTVKLTPLLAMPLTVTTMLPVVAPVGTMATIDVAPQLVIEVTVVVLNFTVLEPCVVPKFVPVIVTDAPTAPEVGDRLVMEGAANETAERIRQTTADAKLRDPLVVTVRSSMFGSGKNPSRLSREPVAQNTLTGATVPGAPSNRSK